MAVFRVNKTKDYTTMSNYHFKDNRITLKAKGLLSQMLSLPEDWDYSIQGLVAINKENEVAISGALDELKKYNYLIISKERNEKGQFEYVYDIYEQPNEPGVCFPGLDEPGVENPSLENQGQLNTKDKELNNKELNNIHIAPSINLIDFLEDNGFILNDILYEIVKTWEDNDLTRHAIEQAVLNNKYNIRYIDKILYSYKKEHISTLEQAIEREEQFRNKGKKKASVPEWFDKEYKEEEMDDETRKLIEEITGT